MSTLPPDLLPFINSHDLALWTELNQECRLRGLDPPEAGAEVMKADNGDALLLHIRMYVGLPDPGSEQHGWYCLTAGCAQLEEDVRGSHQLQEACVHMAFEPAVRRALATVRQVPAESENPGMSFEEKKAACFGCFGNHSDAEKQWQTLQRLCAERQLDAPLWQLYSPENGNALVEVVVRGLQGPGSANSYTGRSSSSAAAAHFAMQQAIPAVRMSKPKLKQVDFGAAKATSSEKERTKEIKTSKPSKASKASTVNSLPSDLARLLYGSSLDLWKLLASECEARGLQAPSVGWNSDNAGKETPRVRVKAAVQLSLPSASGKKPKPAWRLIVTTKALTKDMNKQADVNAEGVNGAFGELIHQLLGVAGNIPRSPILEADTIAQCDAASLQGSPTLTAKWAELKEECKKRGFREPTWTSAPTSVWKVKCHVHISNGADVQTIFAKGSSTEDVLEIAFGRAMKLVAGHTFRAEAYGSKSHHQDFNEDKDSSDSSSDSGSESRIESRQAVCARDALEPKQPNHDADFGFPLDNSSAEAWRELLQECKRAGLGPASVRRDVAGTSSASSVSVRVDIEVGSLSKFACRKGPAAEVVESSNVAFAMAAKALLREISTSSSAPAAEEALKQPVPAAASSKPLETEEQCQRREAAAAAAGLAAAVAITGLGKQTKKKWNELLLRCAQAGLLTPEVVISPPASAAAPSGSGSTSSTAKRPSKSAPASLWRALLSIHKRDRGSASASDPEVAKPFFSYTGEGPSGMKALQHAVERAVECEVLRMRALFVSQKSKLNASAS
eukprot:tig00000204_g17724.t1